MLESVSVSNRLQGLGLCGQEQTSNYFTPVSGHISSILNSRHSFRVATRSKMPTNKNSSPHEDPATDAVDLRLLSQECLNRDAAMTVIKTRHRDFTALGKTW